MHHLDLIILCGIVVAGFICQWLAWRLKVPAILFLLIAGIAGGPVLGWIKPDELLGELLVPFVSIAVAVILFEGALTLKFAELRGHGAVVRNLVSVGVVVTWIVSGLAAYVVLGWDLYLAALFGAIVTVSGPTVIMPLLRTVRPKAPVSGILRWESILIDPLGAILGLLVFEFVVASQASTGFVQALSTLFVMAFGGTLVGAVGGYLYGLAIRHRTIPDYLRDFSALAAVLVVFAAAEWIRSESGLLAVTVMGVWLANMRDVELEDVLGFKESLTLLLVAGLFIVLAARLDIDALMAIGWGAVVVLFILQLLAGPVRAILSSVGGGLSWREQAFLGWVFPRGIVAAAISSLFALRLEADGFAGADRLVPLVFTIIIGTVVIQSLTAGLMARLLRVAEPAPNGVLIVGANRAALAFAEALHKAGLAVMVADSHWANVQKARMLGIRTFFGSAVSSYAESHMDLAGIGNLVAMSRRAGLNELACVKYARDFGRDHVFTVGDHRKDQHEKHGISGEQIGRLLFGGEQRLADLLNLLGGNHEIRVTELSEAFGAEQHREQYPEQRLMFAVDPDGKLHLPVADGEIRPEERWKVAALVPARDDDNGERRD